MATENKPKQPPVWSKLRSLPRKQKLGALAAGGIVVVLIVVLSISSPTTTPSPPGAFTLSSNAGAPDTDGTFSLSWTAASGATSYTVYEHTSFITETSVLTTSVGVTTGLSKALSGKSVGLHYFIVQATNAAGTRRSNCIAVTSALQGWTWMKGNNTHNYNGGYYASQGQPSPANNPAGRQGGVSWTDSDGNLWFFGGFGKDPTSAFAFFSDFWQYDVSTSKWTYLNGSTAMLGSTPNIVESKGESGFGSCLAGRMDGVSWTDNDGNVWIFGGYGNSSTDVAGYLQDLWCYNMESSLRVWVSGGISIDQWGTYGIKGEPDNANTPGGRRASASWTDSNGDFWLFGGLGFGASGSAGHLSDLWRFNVISRQWTWVNGSQLINQYGSYGTKGEGASANTPGARHGGVSWTDSNGDLWLFGGEGLGTSGGSGVLNDLWRYNIASNQWTWVNGSQLINQYGSYGTKGEAASSNTPGGRSESISWVDTSGDVWLFGGNGYGAAGGVGILNDLWRFDVTASAWAHMSGSSSAGMSGIYGEMGTPSPANTPGGHVGSVAWVSTSGGLWFFEGQGYATSPTSAGYLNDLWAYYPAILLPKAFALSSDAEAEDPDGSFSLFWTAAGTANTYTVYQHTSFITVINSSVTTLGTTSSNVWAFSGKLDGTYYYKVQATNGAGTNRSNCLAVSVKLKAWTWVDGSAVRNQTGIYGIKGTPSAANIPGGREHAASWTDATGDLWLFGGNGYNATAGSVGNLNDLWRFDTDSSQWTWVSGSQLRFQYGTYGAKGTPSFSNIPGARYASTSWIDNAGDLWFFGGIGINASGSYGNLNDLWRYNIASNQWTWVNGSQFTDQCGTYGTMGTPSPLNTPGGRAISTSWVDGNSDLWLFGGNGFGASGGNGMLNDLWRFNITSFEWTWMNGSDAVNQFGIYGAMGTPSPLNTPGARQGMVHWVDTDGDFWLFGGSGINATGDQGNLNDLWRFNVTSFEWTWVDGSQFTGQYGIYGNQNEPSTTNTPGGRTTSISWRDASGDLWLFGGWGLSESGGSSLNDLWRFNIASNQWTWVGGSKVANQLGVYGTEDEPSIMNIPGGRRASISWFGTDGNLWLFGGNGYDATSGTTGHLNDLWRYSP